MEGKKIYILFFFFLIEPKKSWFTLISMSLKCKVVFIVRGTWRCSCAHISSTKVRKGQWENTVGKEMCSLRKIDFFFSSIDTSPEGVELYNSCWVFLGNKIT